MSIQELVLDKSIKNFKILLIDSDLLLLIKWDISKFLPRMILLRRLPVFQTHCYKRPYRSGNPYKYEFWYVGIFWYGTWSGFSFRFFSVWTIPYGTWYGVWSGSEPGTLRRGSEFGSWKSVPERILYRYCTWYGSIPYGAKFRKIEKIGTYPDLKKIHIFYLFFLIGNPF